jgi:hypothetical protein
MKQAHVRGHASDFSRLHIRQSDRTSEAVSDAFGNRSSNGTRCRQIVTSLVASLTYPVPTDGFGNCTVHPHCNHGAWCIGASATILYRPSSSAGTLFDGAKHFRLERYLLVGLHVAQSQSAVGSHSTKHEDQPFQLGAETTSAEPRIAADEP